MIVAQLGHAELPGQVIRTGWPIWLGFGRSRQAQPPKGMIPPAVSVGVTPQGIAQAITNANGGGGGCCGGEWW